MPIENRNVEPGTVLTARYKGKDRTCEIVQTGAGLRYRLDDGTEHRSPSSAGRAAMDGVACNGWRFWSVEGTQPAPRASKPKAEKQPKAKAPAKPKKGAAKSKGAKTSKAKGKAMRAAAKGASYGCGVCGETFPTMKAATAHATAAHACE